MQAMFGLAFDASVALEALSALRRSCAPRMLHCGIFRKTSALVRALLSLQYNGDNCDF